MFDTLYHPPNTATSSCVGFADAHKKTQPLVNKGLSNKTILYSNVFNYSMIVATRPEPTVLPPSRFVGYIILLLLGVFQTLFYLYYFKFSLIFEVLIFFRTIVEPRMHKLCFYNYSKPLDLLEYTISNNSPVVSKALNLASKSSSSVFTTALTLSGFS